MGGNFTDKNRIEMDERPAYVQAIYIWVRLKNVEPDGITFFGPFRIEKRRYEVIAILKRRGILVYCIALHKLGVIIIPATRCFKKTLIYKISGRHQGNYS